MKQLRGVCIGAGYFSGFHFDAWRRLPSVEIVAICDQQLSAAQRAAAEFPGTLATDNVEQALDLPDIDFVDIITPPASHLDLVQQAAQRKLAVICQKPFAPSFDEARVIVAIAKTAGIPLMVHENFRFQPWHREIKRMLRANLIGPNPHSLYFRTRTGDGWGEDAYLSRQPYFREMPRLLIHETGVHFIDTFRFLAGEITEVHAYLRRLNPAIQGEDAALVTMQFENGAIGVWDANRYNESTVVDPRYTFGEFLIEGAAGSLRLYGDGKLMVQPLGKPESIHAYCHQSHGFAGDCVYNTQRHFVDCLHTKKAFETNAADYLQTLLVEEAIYQSAQIRAPVRITDCRNILADNTNANE